MPSIQLPSPTWGDFLSGRAALLEMMTDKGRKAAGRPPAKPKPTPAK